MDKAKRGMVVVFKVLLLLSPVLIIAGLAYLFLYGSPFPCLFHETTGYLCPGCGATRSLYSLLHLRLIPALRYNAPFVLLVPLLLYLYIKISVKFITGKDRLPFPTKRPLLWIIVPAIIIIYAVLRNIPVSPFNLLAP